jgi:Uma2 family endonuclease
MSSLAHKLASWSEFQELPERPENGMRYELHDGQVIVVPPPRPVHRKVQKRIERLLEAGASRLGVVETESPYRPAPNLQYWVADIAFIDQADWDAMPPNDFPVYAPVLIVEVLSPSNTPAKNNRQRTIAMAAGTREFWVADAAKRTIQVSDSEGTREHADGDHISLGLLGGDSIAVDLIFAI